MIYFGNAALKPFLEIFEDRLTGILLIDASWNWSFDILCILNWTLLITQRKLKFVRPKVWRL